MAVTGRYDRGGVCAIGLLGQGGVLGPEGGGRHGLASVVLLGRGGGGTASTMRAIRNSVPHASR